MNKYGFVRVSSVIPKVYIGNVEENVKAIKEGIKKSEKLGSVITLFPELTLTSITCNDLFYNEKIIDDALNGLIEITEYTKKYKGVYVIGLPLRVGNYLYNVSAVIEEGNILGIQPKYETNRWFKDGNTINIKTININDIEVPIGNLIFKNKLTTFNVVIGETLTNTNAIITLNQNQSLSLVKRDEYVKNKITSFTSENINALVYTSSSSLESTTDSVTKPITYIVENGDIISLDEELTFDSKIITNDIDILKLLNLKNKKTNLSQNNESYQVISYNGVDTNNKLIREYSDTPFIPNNEKREERFENILNTQSFGLARRLAATGIKTCVLGISGGLDSTLAFLVTVKAFDILKLDRKNIIGITLPGFGTTNRTYTNACSLVTEYGATLKEISIKDACIGHFKDIEHDIEVTDITYENAQARERTQILLDYANKVNGLVVGTGDLSELVLGWCTYNGDHMSNYAVNASIPKTLVRHLTEHVANTETNDNAKEVLLSILATPVSPELLPPSKSGEILQKTENSVGPYILHDFFIYHFLTYGASPSKLYYLATNTFDLDKEEIKKWLKVFIGRFFTQQFKRSCSVDGAKVGNISLSPRGDLNFPSDANREAYLKEIEEL